MIKLWCCGLALLAACCAMGIRSASNPDEPLALNDDEKRAKAQKLATDGNYLEALKLCQELLAADAAPADKLVTDWHLAVQCLASLQRNHELDELLETVVQKHADKWQVLEAAAQTLLSTESYGFVVAGKYSRGYARGGGEWANSMERDRVRALQLMAQAIPLAAAEQDKAEKGRFFQSLANTIGHNRIHQNQWRLQELTDLATLPDLELQSDGGGYGRYGWGWQPQRGAPVDQEGNPVFHTVPDSWDSATSDGQRWRWAMAESEKHHPVLRFGNQWTYLNFLHNQFGVQTLASFGINLGGDDADGGETDVNDPAANPLVLSTLTDDETIAKLATGVRRFKLPDEHNPLFIAKSLADTNESGWASQAIEYLAGVYADRQQFPAAAKQWQIVAARFGNNDHRSAMLKQIIAPWGMLETAPVQPAGNGAKLEYRFRNGRSVSFTARAIDQRKLVADTIDYISGKPGELDWSRTNPAPQGQEFLTEFAKKYVGEKVAEWTTALEPRPNHYDRRTTVTTPLQKAGLYLVSAKMADGNETHIVVEISDLALVRKPVSGQSLYLLADAVTGEPVAGADVEFFGWNTRWNEQRKRNEVITKRFAEKSDADGIVLADQALLEAGMQWLAAARTKDGRFAWLGYSYMWFGNWDGSRPERALVYLMTDRPIYRPGQKVLWKAWVREASYRPASELTSFAGEEFDLVITNPQGTEVKRERVTIDENGAVAAEFVLEDEAMLGAWTFNLMSIRPLVKWSIVSGFQTFRVEEYKKPEFEVTVETPTEPVKLGDTVAAKIKASYYFGGAVTNATVKYKVHRSARDARWFPARRWDWLYGNGYWWFAPDSVWYPGFSKWGCFGPIMPWWGWAVDPPELVLDEETRIGPDGTAEIKIDTALAKALHGDQDHEYTISAEVVDSSRRTITGSGSITVARQPFRVYCWTDIGYARAGDAFTASFAARTPSGGGVAGTAEVRLLKITWKDDGQPEETVVQTWPGIKVAESGEFSQVIQASEPGQFRIAATVDDGKGNKFEAGQLLTVTGKGFDGSDFRYGDLEITLDKAEYKPGDKVRLLVNTNRTGSTVLLWLRPVNGMYVGKPQLLRLKGKSAVHELDVSMDDMPNFFVEATTIAAAKLHVVVRNIVVPPVDKSLNVAIEPSSAEFQPGSEATVSLRVTDDTGEPVVGDLVLTMYDRAIEYISGGSNVTDLREFFWKWTRSHNPANEHTLGRMYWQFARPNDPMMQFLGVFGQFTADQDDGDRGGMRDELKEEGGQRTMLRGRAGGAMPPGAPPMGGGGFGGGAEMAPMAAMEMATDAAPAPSSGFVAGKESEAPSAPMAPAAVRTNFADSAYWNSAIRTGPDGRAEIKLTMPENLTAWKIRTWAMGPASSVGDEAEEVTTTKNILVRLQAPRFFVEKDEIVLSAIVHNYLDVAKSARVSLDLGGNTLAALAGEAKTIEVPAGGDVRVDWRVKATGEGTADITMTAETDVESDAMKMSFPVFVHGMLKTESWSRVVRADQPSATIDMTVPEERRPEQTRLEIRYSPTLAGAMVDALPYLVEYPYGCTEQTLNRFVPTVVTLNILRRMNLDLDDIREKQANLNAQQIGDPAERAAQWKTWDRNPVFDPAEVERMVKQGISDLTAMQCSDGGWGWFSGAGEHSWPHTTVVVVHGLQTAVAADMAIPGGVLERGLQWLAGYEAEQVALLDEWERIRDLPVDKRPPHARYKTQADNLDAFIHMALTDADQGSPKMRDYLYRDRTKLTLYGMGLLGLALDKANDAERRDMVVRNMDQFVVYDEENQSAYIDLPNNAGWWWYWYGDVIEANAFYLKLMSRVRPDDPKTAGVVKYLLNNRRHGRYWNSTRDTATCIEALAEYMVRSKEDQPDLTVEVVVDGEVRRTVKINRENLFSFDGTVVLAGDELSSGAHRIELRREGKGPLYANAYLTNFTLEDDIKAAGLEVKVNRKIYKLVQREDAKASVAGSSGQVVEQAVEKYDRVELANLAEVTSGDLVLVELEIDSKNDYEYVIFEDFKAAGFEPVELQSGYTQGGLGAYVEFRDERVAFFMRSLARGKHSVSYKLRAETPGQFSALPARAAAMYAPELRGNSDEIKLQIGEMPEGSPR